VCGFFLANRKGVGDNIGTTPGGKGEEVMRKRRNPTYLGGKKKRDRGFGR